MKKDLFESTAAMPSVGQLAVHVTAARAGDRAAQAEVVAALTWAAFSCPAATVPAYDLISAAWLGDALPGNIDASAFTVAPLTSEFWTAYWQVVDGAEQGYDAAGITAAVAALGGAVHESFGDLAEQEARQHPGADEPQQKSVPGFIDLEALSECPEDSLGGALHELLTVNGYDAEVLDRDAISLSALPPALRYLNTRILQMHDVWHLAAGYTTNAIHEVAISAFQLAQFGHNYSAMFLAVATQISHQRNPEGFGILLQIIAEAWQHGRATPSLMAIEWEQEFPKAINDIRASHNITAFNSKVPADLLETLTEGTLWRKLGLTFQLIQLNRNIRRRPASVSIAT